MPEAQLIKAVIGSQAWDDGKNVTHELQVDGWGQSVPLYSDDGTVPEAGQYVEVKKSKKGKWYAKLTSAQQAMNGGSEAAQGAPSNDATRVSIERQVAAKCATEIIGPGVKVAPEKRPEFAEWVHFLVDTFADAIAPSAAAKSDEDIPF